MKRGSIGNNGGHAAAGDMGSQGNGPRVMTTMRDFLILSKIGKLADPHQTASVRLTKLLLGR